jgi:hypothetical protein
MPSLLLLPVLDSLCYLLLSAALLVSLPLMLSTTEVSSVTVLGITGTGVEKGGGPGGFRHVLECFMMSYVLVTVC